MKDKVILLWVLGIGLALWITLGPSYESNKDSVECPRCPAYTHVECPTHAPAPAPAPAHVPTEYPKLPSPSPSGRTRPKCVHGHLIATRCFCDPGYDGATCEDKWTEEGPKECTKDYDWCFYHPKYGVVVIDQDRWVNAQSHEQTNWNGNRASGDRQDDHTTGFRQYASVPDDLGDVVEIGAGPWTQSLHMFRSRSTFKVKTVTIWEPSLFAYMNIVPTCAYKTGKLAELPYPLIMVQAGAEHVKGYELYDTLYMTNVLEHVLNAYNILDNIYNVLKPGGLLIFNDRWWDHYDFSTPNWENDRALHPIRIKKVVFEYFLSLFDEIFRDDNSPMVSKYTTQGKPNVGTYFIGRKKAVVP